MALFVKALPIAPGRMAHFENFMEQLNGERRDEFVSVRRSLGVRERTFHQHTAVGEFVIVTLEGDDPETAFAKFAEGDDPFTKWFVEEVRRIHSIDPTGPATGADATLMIDSGDPS